MKSAARAPFAPDCNATAIREASRRVTQFYDRTIEPSGLRSTQLAILQCLVETTGKPMPIGELAEALVLDRSALGHNLRPLLRDGFVQLVTCGEDRRRNRVSVTPLGRAKWREARKLWRKAQRRFEASIGPRAADTLRKTMAAIARSPHLGAR